MTPFQAQCTRHIRHMKVVTPNLGQQHFPFKRFGPLSERSRRFSSRGANKSLRHAAARARQNHPDIRAAHRSFSRQQHQPLHHIDPPRAPPSPPPPPPPAPGKIIRTPAPPPAPSPASSTSRSTTLRSSR